MTTKLKTQNLFKIFGPEPESAMELAREGVAKEEIFRRTTSVVAVDDVSFEVAEKEIFVVMGLSGSGKSTLVRCLNRLIEPTSGTVEVDGENVLEYGSAALREFRLRRISMVFQHFALLPHKSVVENAAYGLKARGMGAAERREKALEALEAVGLDAWADAYPENLSGGMQQRVGLARALAVDPEILLMDEPFGALDPLIRREMQNELLQLQERYQTTIIFITHDLHEALTLGDKIAIMKDGAFVQSGPPQEIVAEPATDYVSAFTQDVDRSRVFTLSGIARPDPAAVPAGASLREARAKLSGGDGTGPVFVIDDKGAPVGLLPAADLAGADPDATVETVMRRDVARLPGTTPLHEALGHCAKDGAVAVVDASGRLQAGVSTRDMLAGLASEAP